MGYLYLAALVFGGGLLALQLILGTNKSEVGQVTADGELDLDPATDLDASAEVGVVGGHGAGNASLGDHGNLDGVLPILLSLRFWMFATAGFGMLGSSLHFTGLSNEILTAIAASVVGVTMGYFATWLFNRVKATNATSAAEPTEAIGEVATVLVPVAAGARGKVRVQLRGQSIDYLATTDGEPLAAGMRVLIEDITDGEVRVSEAPVELVSPSSRPPPLRR